MTQNVIKIKFQNDNKGDALSWEDYERKIMRDLETGHVSSYKVYMKNAMPISEINGVINELCNTISYHYNYVTKSYRNEECAVAGSNDMLLSATYYIELK